jgi:hypothetical protein
MAAIYSNGGNRWNILGFIFAKRDALSSVYKISMVSTRHSTCTRVKISLLVNKMCLHCLFPVDCERSLLSAGLDFRACERKGGTANNTSRNEIHNAKFPLVEINTPVNQI